MLTLTCPSREELLAYAAGRLADETSESIAAHLDSCPDCQAGLVTLDDAEDTFVAQLRQPPATDPYLEESQCRLAVARARAALETTGADARTPIRPFALRDGPGRVSIDRGVGPRRHGHGLQGPAHQARSGGRTEGAHDRPHAGPAGDRPLRTRDEGHRQVGPSPHRPRLRRPGDRRHAGAGDGIHRGARLGGDRPPPRRRCR